METIEIEERRFPGILFGIWLQNLDVGDIKQDVLPLFNTDPSVVKYLVLGSSET